MNANMKESSSEQGLTGRGDRGEGSSTTTQTTPELQGRQLTEYFKKEMAAQREKMRIVEEKCHAILVKIPLMEHRTEDVVALRMELELEREQRKEQDKQFTESIDLLKTEVNHANLKVANLEKVIENMNKQSLGPTAPATTASSHECVSEVVGRLINDLSDDINARFEVVEENQNKLHVWMENTSVELSKSSVEGPFLATIAGSNMDVGSNPVNDFGVEMQTGKEFTMSGVLPTAMEETRRNETSMPPTSIAPAVEVTRVDKVVVGAEARSAFGIPGVPPMAMEEPGHNNSTKPPPIIPSHFQAGPVQAVHLGVGAEPASPDDVDFIHGQSPVPGVNLPLLCLCGLEFASTSSLTWHIVKERVEKRRRAPNLESILRPAASTSTLPLQPHPTSTSNLGLSKTSASVPSAPTTKSVDSQPVTHGLGKQVVDAAGKPMFYCKCWRRFNSRNNLEYHVRVASSGVLFQCVICSTQFSVLGSLRFHMKQRHQVEYLMGKKSCSICGLTFDNMKQLLVHQATSHPKNM